MRSVFNNFITASKGEVGASLLNFISLMILARTLGVEIFGIYVLFYAYHEVLNRVFNFQTWQAFIKFGTEVLNSSKPEEIKNLFATCFLIDIVSMIFSTIVAVVGAKHFVNYFNISGDYLFLLQMVSFSIIFYAAEMYIGVLRVYGEYVLQAKILVGIAFIRLLIFITTSLLYPSLKGFVCATIICALIGLGVKSITAYSVMRANTSSTNVCCKYRNWKNLASFIFYNNLDITVRMITRQADVLVLGRLFSVEVAGAYKLAVHIGSIFGKLAQPIFQVFYPELTKLFSQDKGFIAKELAKKICGYLFLFMISCYICYFAFGNYFITKLFGESYELAYKFGLVYLFSVVIAISVAPLSSVIMAKGLAKNAFYNQVLVTIVFLVIFSLTVQQYSGYSAGFSHIVFNIFWTFLALYTIKRHKVFTYEN